ncbi:MAG TPA: ankyrin repeat domain-containing protein [Thiothrix sp.]|nr:ankyrin repeat domain-containing protein [Thiothrix sp.]
MKKTTQYFLAIVFYTLFSSGFAVEYSQEELNIKLFHASKGGYIATVKQLVEMGADVNSSTASKETALHAAASTGKLDVIKFLRQKGAKANPRTVTGWIPLHHATRFGHIDVVNYLIATGTPMYIRTQSGQNVFDLAKATKNEAMLNVLENWKRRPKH